MILGLDFATCTGWAHEDGKSPAFGTWDLSTRNAHPGKRFDSLRHHLHALHAARPFWLIWAEDASFGSHHETTKAFHNSMRGIVCLVAYELNSQVSFVVPSQWKKWVGHGRLSKGRTIELARLHLNVAPRNDNEADALWILEYGKHRRNNPAPAPKPKQRKPRKTKEPRLFDGK